MCTENSVSDGDFFGWHLEVLEVFSGWGKLRDLDPF